MIYNLADDECPTVDAHDGRVITWVDDNGERIAIRMTTEAATTLALRLLAQVGQLCGDDIPITPATSLVIRDMRTMEGQPAWRVGFKVEDTAIAVQLDLDQFSDAAAEFAAAARAADRVTRPRPDLG